MSSNLVPGEDLLSSDIESVKEICNEMVAQSGLRICHVAYESLYTRGLPNDTFVMVCVEWLPHWRALMDKFLPGHNWEEGDDSEEVAYISVQVPFSFCELLSEYFPGDAEIIMEPPSDGKVKVIALAGEGFTLYEVDPWPLQLQ